MSDEKRLRRGELRKNTRKKREFAPLTGFSEPFLLCVVQFCVSLNSFKNLARITKRSGFNQKLVAQLPVQSVV